MKKTLITLAALAMVSVACAATYTDTYTATDFNTDASNDDGSWKVLTLTNTLDNSCDWILTATITIGTDSYNTWGTPALATGDNVFSKSGLQVYLSNKDYQGTVEHPLKTGWFSGEHDDVTMSGTHAGDVLTLTYSFDKDGGDNGTGLLHIDYTLQRNGTTYTDDNSSWYTNTDVANMNALNISKVSTTIGTADLEGWTLDSLTVTRTLADTPAVPEPTTATLSLLALAGLAARRRRK